MLKQKKGGNAETELKQKVLTPDEIIYQEIQQRINKARQTKSLSLYGYRLKNFPNLPRDVEETLEKLDISYNHFNELTLNMPNLKYLDCRVCKLNSLLLYTPKLEHLDAELNNLKILELQYMPNLQFLNFRDNPPCIIVKSNLNAKSKNTWYYHRVNVFISTLNKSEKTIEKLIAQAQEKLSTPEKGETVYLDRAMGTRVWPKNTILKRLSKSPPPTTTPIPTPTTMPQKPCKDPTKVKNEKGRCVKPKAPKTPKTQKPCKDPTKVKNEKGRCVKPKAPKTQKTM